MEAQPVKTNGLNPEFCKLVKFYGFKFFWSMHHCGENSNKPKPKE